MPIQLPIYLRGRTFVLHTRINGKQVKRSLHTTDKHLATIRAVQLLESLITIPTGDPTTMPIPDLDYAMKAAKSHGKKYEIDLGRGVLKADGPEDHKRMMQALKAMPKPAAPAVTSTAHPVMPPSTLTLRTLMEKFFSFRDHLSEATRIDYGTNVEEFDKFYPGLTLDQITDEVITEYIEKLKAKGNTGKTADKKIACVRSMFNFAIKQKLFKGVNPASDRRLAPKNSSESGQKPFLENDLKAIFGRDEFKAFKKTEPNFYLVLRLGLITGMRVSSAASLQAWQLKITIDGTHYIDIDDDKTKSGRRDVPIPKGVWTEIKNYLDEHENFGITERKGKGYSDEIRKFFDKYLASIGYQGKKLSYHSFRKTFNALMKRKKIPLEMRSEFIGHKVEGVNAEVYSPIFSVDELGTDITPIQKKLLEDLGI